MAVQHVVFPYATLTSVVGSNPPIVTRYQLVEQLADVVLELLVRMALFAETKRSQNVHPKRFFSAEVWQGSKTIDLRHVNHSNVRMIGVISAEWLTATEGTNVAGLIKSVVAAPRKLLDFENVFWLKNLTLIRPSGESVTYYRG